MTEEEWDKIFALIYENIPEHYGDFKNVRDAIEDLIEAYVTNAIWDN